MNLSRRHLLAGASAAAAARALAQPVPLGGPVGYQTFPPGPLLGANQGAAPGNSPTLDLSFMTPGTLDPAITFTRASTGTYFDSGGVLRTAATNAPRWDYDPVSLQLRGLLLEDARTNLWLQSADASNAAWLKLTVTVAAPVVTGNQSVAPDGNTTAARVVYPSVPSGPNVSVLSESLTVTAAAYTFSVWLKGSAGGEIVYLSTTSDTVLFYRQQCVLTTAWRRFTLTTPALTAAIWGFSIGNDGRNGGPAISAATVFVWGTQVELGGFATSYIPTTAAAVTRARDACSVPVANITGYDATKGSLFIEYNLVGFNMSFNAPVQLVGSNAGTDYISVDEMTTAGSTPSLATIVGVSDAVGGTVLTSSNYGALGSVTAPAGTIQKGASAWMLSTPIAGAHNGISTSSATGTATSLPTVANLMIAGGMHFQNQLSLWARRVVYWPRALSNAEMQQVTTITDPSLYLNFMNPGVLDPRITFTRASTATYTDASGTIQTAATNVPRWDYDPVTHALKGLLIEEARTNVCLSSGAVGIGPSWQIGTAGVAAATITANNVIAPDGTTTGTSIAYPAVPGAGNLSAVYQNLTVTAAVYTFSVWLRGAVGGEQLYLGINVSNTSYSHAPRITLTTQWQRFTYVTPTLTAAAWTFDIGTDLRDGTQASTPAQTVYAWGAQVELGAFPTSYIPTTAAAVTRAQDAMSMPTAAWFNANFGTLMGELIYNGQISGGFGHVLDLVGANTNTDSIGLYIQQTNNHFSGQIRNGGTNGYVSPAITIIPGAVIKGAIAYQPALASVACNGVVQSATALTTPLPAITTLAFMPAAGYQLPCTGYMRRVTYWPRVLSDAEMQQVTT